MNTLAKIILCFFCSLASNQLYSQFTCTLGAELPAAEKLDIIDFRSEKNIYEIPVVFHVVGNQDFHNKIPYTVINNLITHTNDILLGKNKNLATLREEFAPIVGFPNITLKIEEVIYQTTEKYFILDLFGTTNNLEDAKQTALGGSDPWDTERYLNIWICDIITSDARQNTFSGGYASPPVNAPGWPAEAYDYIQGILLNDIILPGNLDVLVHELGHYLGLRHVVEIFNSNCMDNDGIEDTPRSSRSPECSYFDSCPGDMADMTENYMNPQVLDCRSAFTKGQVNHMRQILRTFRPNLFTENIFIDANPPPALTVYPTITQGELFIRFDDCNLKFINYTIHNMTGAFISGGKGHATEEAQFEVFDLSPGLYFFKFEFNDNTYMNKIIKI